MDEVLEWKRKDSKVNQAVHTSGIALEEAPAVYMQDMGDYSPWKSMQPTSWMPYFVYSTEQIELGLYSYGKDVLNRHNFSIFTGVDLKQHWPLLTFDYYYDHWWPVFSLQGSMLSEAQLNVSGDVQRIRRTQNVSANMILPVLSVDHKVALIAGVNWRSDRDGWAAAGATPMAKRKDNLVGVALSFDSTYRHLLSISKTDGRKLLLSLERHIFDSDYDGNVYTMDWREFAGLGGEHVLAMRFVVGYGEENSRDFTLGGESSNMISSPSGLLFDTSFNQRLYNLRGYASGLPELTGKRMAFSTLEYRFPILRLERGFMTPPIGLEKMHANIFMEGGGVTNIGKIDRFYTSVGTELTFDIVLGYYLQLPLVLGYAKGLDKTIGEHRVYLRSSQSF